PRAMFRRQLEAERLSDGLWGMHPHGESSLYVTTLAYVSGRMQGIAADDALFRDARALFAREDVLTIPTWGKAWLAIAGVYDWSGLHAVPPEAWLLPKANPLHPAGYYCHTRLIYLGMASVFGARIQLGDGAMRRALREELYPGRSYADLDWKGARDRLRAADLWAPPTKTLKALYRTIDRFEPLLRWAKPVRSRLLARFREAIRFELRTTSHTCLSPVNGLLFMLSLDAADPDDLDLKKQIEAFEGWIFEDEAEGLRVVGARSAPWDTAFALQGLGPAFEVTGEQAEAIRESAAWLETQQLEGPRGGYAVSDYLANDRVDPTGGFCFADAWHGWPVSDCTAEALEAFLHLPAELYAPKAAMIDAGVRFLLQAQNADGGFGSYEARKHGFELEWMNPAEMFGDSMTELSYVECTASNLSALCAVRKRFPELRRDAVERAIHAATQRLRAMQNPDGSWDGVWGVTTLYGTMFGVRGLRAAGVSPDDPAIRRAVQFVQAKQRPDGSWGEHWRSCLEGRYLEAEASHPTQTAWALTTLVMAGSARPDAMARAAAWLADAQTPEGDWESPFMAGVFFRTALLDYRMYRRIFPVQALGTYLRSLQETTPWQA
ncbi:MAG: prenyltransferase/squalene oxidase repeat-containing protein, partial [Myxococcota bacterium]